MFFRTIGTALAGAALATGLGFGAPALAQDGPIKVGVIFPLSGGAGPQGQHVNWALDAMAAMINEDGGVLGRKIELVSRDDESTPAVGVSRANELISQGVSVIIEGWNSPVTLAMQPVISRADILDITAISKADPILSGEGNPLAIRLNSSNALDGAAVAKFIAGEKASRIAFLTENDAYGNGAQASIEAALKEIGHSYEKVAEEKFPFDQADFRVQLSNVKAANPDVTVAINANEGLGMPAIIRQAKRSRLPGQLVAAVGTVAPSVIKVAGDAADGLVGADIYFPDVEPFKSNAVNQRFIEKTKSLHDYTPDKFMALAAASLQVWAMAANEVKSLDKKPVAERIRGGSFSNTILGDITFAANGQLQSNYYLFDVKDQKIVVRSGSN
ncbi:ABC transporter substrate-binding protein [Rhizobium sp. SSA_523]|uniref:ABC transporter substrate-binding protein n=1 Tax=Rhizobium sp. SSA_523 TaxID=2952477 RepID=UPI0020902B3B|nr:ABC transporter substrate-binding protein [Rhizobium sp. SSA_523]MCO5731651.1 ABC transporter substrate-binding protein [Rhizobium sp. SSA_523]WKC21843.1 ABC transporter substrate-binding protein [Rhizobium sp. SSA_523]